MKRNFLEGLGMLFAMIIVYRVLCAVFGYHDVQIDHQGEWW